MTPQSLRHSLRLMALLTCWAAPLQGNDATAMQSARSQEQLVLPDIPVTDSHGLTGGFVSRYGDAGPVLISFLYTNCTENCGMIISVMGLVDQDLQAAGAPPLHLIAISVDPWRDTPEVLDEVARSAWASDKWDWVVASTADTPAFLSAFGLAPGPVATHEAVYLLGDLRSGRFTRFSGMPEPAELIAAARQIPATK